MSGFQVGDSDNIMVMGQTLHPNAATARLSARLRRRRWLRPLIALSLVLVILLGSVRVLGWTGREPYRVSVAVTLQPHDPALWSMVNAEGFDAARAIDASLPDPRSLLTSDSLTSVAAPANPDALRMERYTGPSARRYVFRGLTATDTARAHYCLTAALYYEAASESDDGMRGVAQVILNRVRHPSFPGSICGVVFQGSQRAIVCQFTFSCDGSMARAPSRGPWTRASRIAAEALAGRVFPNVGMATHYHTLAVWPAWGRSLATTNVIGAHIFHRWRGRWGEPDAFLRPYAGREPAPGPYLPITQQIAARAGRAVTLPGAVPATGNPAALDQATMSAIQAAQAQAAAAGQQAGAAPAAGTTGAAAANGVVPIAPMPPQSARNRAEPAPTYNDPRLSGSGSVREEFRNSGSVITR